MRANSFPAVIQADSSSKEVTEKQQIQIYSAQYIIREVSVKFNDVNTQMYMYLYQLLRLCTT